MSGQQARSPLELEMEAVYHEVKVLDDQDAFCNGPGSTVSLFDSDSVANVR